MKLKYFLSLIGIDVVFLVSFYFFTLFIVNKLRTLMFGLQDYTAEIGGIENIMAQNMSLVDFGKLSALTGTLKGVLSEILGYFFVGILGIFLLYCLFQGMNWNLAYNFLKNKTKLDYKYVLKFSLVSILFVSLGLFLLYHFLLSARYVLLGKLIYTSFEFTDLLKMIGYGIFLMLLMYFSFIFYALLNKYNLKKTIMKVTSYLEVKSLFWFLVSFGGIVAVIYLFLSLGIQNVVVYIVQVVLISLIVEKYRIYLLKDV